MSGYVIKIYDFYVVRYSYLRALIPSTRKTAYVYAKTESNVGYFFMEVIWTEVEEKCIHFLNGFKNFKLWTGS